jgi:hypothetical protein
MIKVSVMYPNTRGARFDHAYYRDRHMPLVKARMAESCAHTVFRRPRHGTNDRSRPPRTIVRRNSGPLSDARGTICVGFDVGNNAIHQKAEIVFFRAPN